jgi:hypothetical protein
MRMTGSLKNSKQRNDSDYGGGVDDIRGQSAPADTRGPFKHQNVRHEQENHHEQADVKHIPRNNREAGAVETLRVRNRTTPNREAGAVETLRVRNRTTPQGAKSTGDRGTACLRKVGFSAQKQDFQKTYHDTGQHDKQRSVEGRAAYPE